MNLPTHFKKILILPVRTFLSLDRPFSLMAMKGNFPNSPKKTQLIINLSKII